MLKVDEIKLLLLDHIRRCRSAGCQRLPTERSLAADFGCSRSTVGKALGILSAEGLIERRGSSGTYISDFRPPAVTVAVLLQHTYQYTDAHFRLVIDTLSEHARRLGLRIKIYDHLIESFAKPGFADEFQSSVKDGLISGLLIASRMPLRILASLHSLCPVVSINNIFAQGQEIPAISCDYFRVGFLAARHLLEHDHRRIAFLTESLEHPESWLDLSGFRSALEMYGLELSQDNILETRLNLNSLNSTVRNFFAQKRYSACFVRSTSLALQILPVLQQDSIRIPQDISIVAAGNYQPGRQQQIQLTSIDNRLDEMCRLGLEFLKKKISRPELGFSNLTLLEPSLQTRNSVLHCQANCR
ncbi:MAG: GntR family transcriptional regulator [Lentisphaeria bacterium]|jgi:DNA-binding LacI/PurR family transcriptional regulator|nr:GntR family transcriptional regulator [Lentisphaeria bacterium]